MKKASVSSPNFLDRIYPWLLTVGGSIGLLAAFQLSLEKITLLEDPQAVLSCDINPIISCGSVIVSDQATAFGFPNPFLGLIGFAVIITVGVALLAGARFKKWFWQGLLLGALSGAVFIHWLIFETVDRLNALCPYCLIVWLVTIPIFLHTLLYAVRHGYWLKQTGRVVEFLQKNHLSVLLVWYLAIMIIILQHFWYYFETVI